MAEPTIVPQITAPPMQAPPPAPLTPQTQFVPASQPPTQAAALPQIDNYTSLRHQIAQGLNVPIDEVPTDPAGIAQVVKGGYAAHLQLKQYQQQLASQQPTNTTTISTVAQPPAPQEAKPITMPAGWERYVAWDGKSYNAADPLYVGIAQAANHNLRLGQGRTAALESGAPVQQVFPDFDKAVNDKVEEKLAREREHMSAQVFVDNNLKDLVEHDEYGQPRTQLASNGQSEYILNELGKEFNLAAREVAGVVPQEQLPQRQSQIAKLALQIAKDRVKLRQPTSPQSHNTSPPAQANKDLQMLFNQHNANQARGTSSVNTAPQALTIAQALRNDMTAVPDGLNGLEYAQLMMPAFR